MKKNIIMCLSSSGTQTVALLTSILQNAGEISEAYSRRQQNEGDKWLFAKNTVQKKEEE